MTIPLKVSNWMISGQVGGQTHIDYVPAGVVADTNAYTYLPVAL